jgi:hypothetical protein
VIGGGACVLALLLVKIACRFEIQSVRCSLSVIVSHWCDHWKQRNNYNTLMRFRLVVYTHFKTLFSVF